MLRTAHSPSVLLVVIWPLQASSDPALGLQLDLLVTGPRWVKLFHLLGRETLSAGLPWVQFLTKRTGFLALEGCETIAGEPVIVLRRVVAGLALCLTEVSLALQRDWHWGRRRHQRGSTCRCKCRKGDLGDCKVFAAVCLEHLASCLFDDYFLLVVLLD